MLLCHQQLLLIERVFFCNLFLGQMVGRDRPQVEVFGSLTDADRHRQTQTQNIKHARMRKLKDHTTPHHIVLHHSTRLCKCAKAKKEEKKKGSQRQTDKQRNRETEGNRAKTILAQPCLPPDLQQRALSLSFPLSLFVQWGPTLDGGQRRVNGGHGEDGDRWHGQKVFCSNKDQKSPLWVKITHATGLVYIHSIHPDQTKQNQDQIV